MKPTVENITFCLVALACHISAQQTNLPPTLADQQLNEEVQLCSLADKICSSITISKDEFTERYQYDSAKPAEFGPLKDGESYLIGGLYLTVTKTKDNTRRMFLTLNGFVNTDDTDKMKGISAIDFKIGEKYTQIIVTPERLNGIKAKLISGEYSTSADVTLSFQLTDDEIQQLDNFISGERVLVRVESDQPPTSAIDAAGIQRLRVMFDCYKCLSNADATGILNSENLRSKQRSALLGDDKSIASDTSCVSKLDDLLENATSDSYRDLFPDNFSVVKEASAQSEISFCQGANRNLGKYGYCCLSGGRPFLIGVGTYFSSKERAISYAKEIYSKLTEELGESQGQSDSIGTGHWFPKRCWSRYGTQYNIESSMEADKYKVIINVGKTDALNTHIHALESLGLATSGG